MNETKVCPYCGEEIMVTAKKCRYCHEWLEEDVKTETENDDGININWWKWIKAVFYAAILIAALATVPSEQKHQDVFVTSMRDVIRDAGSKELSNEDAFTQVIGNSMLQSNKITDALILRSFTLEYHNWYLFSYGVARNKLNGNEALVTIGAFGFVISLADFVL